MIEDRTKVSPIHRSLKRSPSGQLSGSVKADESTSVEIWDDRFRLPVRLYFSGRGPDSPLVGVEIGSEEHRTTPVDPAQLAYVVNQLPVLVAYARAEIDWGAGGSREALIRALDDAGTTRRGKPGKFFRIIGEEYSARVREGDGAPVTAIAAAHDVSVASASRWVKEARRRGYLRAS